MALRKKTLLRRLRNRMRWPRTKLAWAALFCLACSVFLRALAWLSYGSKQSGSLLLWLDIFLFFGVMLALLVGFRWVTRKLLWRLRNRLVVTYLFIGLAPVILLVLLSGISAYIFAGQFAAYLAASRVNEAMATVQ